MLAARAQNHLFISPLLSSIIYGLSELYMRARPMRKLQTFSMRAMSYTKRKYNYLEIRHTSCVVFLYYIAGADEII